MDGSLVWMGATMFLERCIFSKSSLGRCLFWTWLEFSCSSKLRFNALDSPGTRFLLWINFRVEGVISARTTWLIGKSSDFLTEFTRSPLTSSSDPSGDSEKFGGSLCRFSWFAYLSTDKIRCPGDVWRLVEWISTPAFPISCVSFKFSSLSFAFFNPPKANWCAFIMADSLRFAVRAVGKLRLRFGLLCAFPAKSKSNGSDQEQQNAGLILWRFSSSLCRWSWNASVSIHGRLLVRAITTPSALRLRLGDSVVVSLGAKHGVPARSYCYPYNTLAIRPPDNT